MDERIALRPDHADSELLDDVVVRDVSIFRAEMMDNRTLWMCCYFPGTDERLTFHVRAVQRRPGGVRLEVYAVETPHGEGFTYEPVGKDSNQ